MPKFPVCKGKEAVRAFEKDGWNLARYIDDLFNEQLFYPKNTMH